MPDNFELETRSYEFRAQTVDTEKREIRGTAVPYGKDANIGGSYVERFAPGAVQDSDDALFYWRHSEPIGKVTSAEHTKEGWEIVARVSETTLGNDALTLARDGVVVQLSVGFEPGGEYDVEERENDIPIITRTKVRVREVSQVPFGAYDSGATISEVRAASSANQNKEGQEMTDENKNDADILEIRESIEELDRKVATFSVREEEPVLDTRSAGAVLKAIVDGDESTIREYEALQERAYTGGTSADAVVKPGWVGDLTKIFDASSGVLSNVFSTGTLPSTGNSIEYAELATNTIDVTEQEAEGDDITFGKVSITTKTAPVKTYAGGTQLTRQSIERSSVGVLNTSLEALATAAGARKKAVLRAAFNAAVTAREAVATNGGVVLLGATLATGTAGNWEDALVDAALKFEAQALAPEALVVSGSVFKKLRSLTVAGERVFTVAEKNSSGSLDLTGLVGNLAGIPVFLDSGATGDKAVFVNGRAIRQYDSGLVSLSDENIVNLSKTFAVYRYGAVAAEIPAGIVPIKLAAS